MEIQEKKEIVKNFDIHMKACLDLIRDGNDVDARKFFNEKIYPSYSKYIYEGFMGDLFVLFADLNEYFNNVNAKILNFPSSNMDYICSIDKEEEYIQFMNKWLK